MNKQLFEAQFDSHPGKVGSVEVIPDNKGNLELWINIGDDRKMVITTWRDQWGVFIDVHRYELSIAQEDQTRSFLDALCQACQFLRTQCEVTEPATIVKSSSND